MRSSRGYLYITVCFLKMDRLYRDILSISPVHFLTSSQLHFVNDFTDFGWEKSWNLVLLFFENLETQKNRLEVWKSSGGAPNWVLNTKMSFHFLAGEIDSIVDPFKTNCYISIYIVVHPCSLVNYDLALKSNLLISNADQLLSRQPAIIVSSQLNLELRLL